MMKENSKLTATYSVNGIPIEFKNLKTIQITRKDYIDYVEGIKKEINGKTIK